MCLLVDELRYLPQDHREDQRVMEWVRFRARAETFGKLAEQVSGPELAAECLLPVPVVETLSGYRLGSVDH